MKLIWFKIHKWLRFKYVFTKSEASVSIIFAILIFVMIVINIYLENYYNPEKKNTVGVAYFNDSIFKKETDNYKSKNSYATLNNNEDLESGINLNKNFDPNEVDSQFWLKKVGLTERQVISLEKYKKIIGSFKNKKDVENCFALKYVYSLIEPYLVFYKISKSIKEVNINNSNKTLKSYQIELNQADTAALVRLPAIGSVLAMRIVKYREKLGGFCSKFQLLEVFGIDSMKYSLFENRITLDNYFIEKININEATLSKLKNHPYFDNHTARSIIMYRNTHGKFNKISDLKNCDLISETLLLKINPYLSF